MVGKFFPFHKGHQYLIDTAMYECEKVTVLVCSLPGDSIPGYWRYKWVSEQYTNTNVSVKWSKDILPQYPKEDKNFWEIWNKVALRNAPNLTHIYSSERYGKIWAQKLNVKYRNVDIDRRTFPISGTKCRNNIFENWDMLNEKTQKDIGLKICFVGAESTGKSTISKRIAEELNLPWVREYGREYCDKLIEKDGLDDYELTPRDFRRIAEKQSELIRIPSKVKILDTDIVSTAMWYNLMIGDSNVYIEKIASYSLNTIYVLIDHNCIEWEDDGTRKHKERREWQQKWTIDFLNECGKEYVLFNDVDIIDEFIKDMIDDRKRKISY